MRGIEQDQGNLFSYVQLENRVPAKHPLRKIRELADQALKAMDAKLCWLPLCSRVNRP